MKFANLVHVTHRDEVEPPFTDWLREAYELQDAIGVAKRGQGKDCKGGHREGVKPAKATKIRENEYACKDSAGCKRSASRRRL